MSHLCLLSITLPLPLGVGGPDPTEALRQITRRQMGPQPGSHSQAFAIAFSVTLSFETCHSVFQSVRGERSDASDVRSCPHNF